MDLRHSTTVQVLGLVGVVIGVVGLVSLGWLFGVVALAVVVVVALIGFWRERTRGLDKKVVRFTPAAIGQLDAIRCGVDRTAPWLLEKTAARDGEHLLSFVSRSEDRAVGRRLARAVNEERSVVVALIGESKAGKTRCVFEAVRKRVPQGGLAVATEQERTLSRSVADA